MSFFIQSESGIIPHLLERIDQRRTSRPFHPCEMFQAPHAEHDYQRVDGGFIGNRLYTMGRFIKLKRAWNVFRKKWNWWVTYSCPSAPLFNGYFKREIQRGGIIGETSPLLDRLIDDGGRGIQAASAYGAVRLLPVTNLFPARRTTR